MADFKLGDYVLFRGYKSKIIGFRNSSTPYVIHREEEALKSSKIGWNPNRNETVFEDFSFTKKINISHYKNCYYVYGSSLTLIRELEKQADSKIIKQKEDTAIEKLILKKLVKMQKNYE